MQFLGTELFSLPSMNICRCSMGQIQIIEQFVICVLCHSSLKLAPTLFLTLDLRVAYLALLQLNDLRTYSKPLVLFNGNSGGVWPDSRESLSYRVKMRTEVNCPLRWCGYSIGYWFQMTTAGPQTLSLRLEETRQRGYFVAYKYKYKF